MSIEKGNKISLTKLRNIILLIVAAGAVLFYFSADVKKFGQQFRQPKELAKSLKCEQDIIDARLLEQKLRLDEEVRLLVSFHQRPNTDVKDYFEDNGVTLHLNTWVFDYVLAETSVKDICFLAETPGITRVALAS